MLVLRANFRGTCRTRPLNRTGTFDDGRTWSVWEVEVIDGDANKVKLKCDQSLSVEPGGIYNFVVDVAVKGNARVVIVDAQPVTK